MSAPVTAEKAKSELDAVAGHSNDTFQQWLAIGLAPNGAEAYRHIRLDEATGGRAKVLSAFQEYVHRAHASAVRGIREVLRDPLHPFNPPGASLQSGYPYQLPSVTLQGYLGEVLAGLIAEHFSPFGQDDWRVATFMFRTHDLAFNALEKWRRTGASPQTMVGHFGDDCVAFRTDSDGTINQVLVCEAKCTTTHDSQLIGQGHTQLSGHSSHPVSLWRMIELLEQESSESAKEWLVALRRLYHTSDVGLLRSNLLVYVCGKRPVKKACWIRRDAPHDAYKGKHRLEAVEIHLEDVEDLIRLVYRDSMAWEAMDGS